jgi:MFS family permease
MATTTITEATELEGIHTTTNTTPRESSQWEQPDHTLTEPITTPAKPSNLRIVSTVLQLASLNLLSSFTNGVITVGLTTIARDISLPRELYLWPLSVYGLTCGSMLLMAGSITDVVGPRRVELVAAFLLGVFVLACGVADTGLQLTLFRAFQGVAMAMHLPAAVSIVAGAVPRGKARNMSFAALGFARDIGYSVGLVLSGFLIETRGWRLNFYLAGGGVLVLAAVAAWSLPMERDSKETTRTLLQQLWRKVDWAGAVIISAGLALLAYVLA